MQYIKSLRFISMFACFCSVFTGVFANQTVPLTGQFKVSQQGAATYTLPIEVPAARGGLAPEIALNYSSTSSDGYLGMGWSLSASSVIARCPQSFAQDGQLRGVDLTREDKFCLDGQRLVLISGQYGENNSQYIKELDDASVVTALGQQSGGGPAAFKLETKAGEIHYFGDLSSLSNLQFNDIDGNNSEEDAAISVDTQTGPVTRLWALKAIEDSLGNYISYHYQKSDTEQVLTSIDYAGHRDGELPYTQVKFHYTANPHPKSGYVYGEAVSVSKLLSHIEITLDNQHQRTYFLDYSTSSKPENLNFLDSVQACIDVDRRDCTTAVSFDWTRRSFDARNFNPFVTSSNALSTPIGEYRTAQTFDMDGDGYSDLIYVRNGAWYKRTLSNGEEERLTTFGTGKAHFAQSIDFDGDGQRDLLIAANETSNWKVISFKPSTQTSTSCEPNGGGTQLCEDIDREVAYTLTDLNRLALGFEGNALVADVNGDALEDIVFLKDGMLQWYRNLGGTLDSAKILYSFSLEEKAFFESSIINSAPSFKTSAAVDVNGDGLTDLLLKVRNDLGDCLTSSGVIPNVSYRECVSDLLGTWRSNGTSGWRLFVSTGNNFSPRQIIPGTEDVEHLRVADLNGDGLTDIAYVRDNAWYQRLSDGVRFLRETGLGEENAPLAANDTLDKGTFFLDLNGDGRSDMLRPSLTEMRVFISTPGSSDDAVNWEERGSFPFVGTLGETVRFADVNGEGRLSLYYVQNNQWRLHQPTQPRFNHTINRITDGFGVSTDITYEYLTRKDAENVYKTQVSSNLEPSKNFSTIPALQVVKRVNTSTGPSTYVGVRYEYGGLLVNRLGRGFQGFELLRTIDEQSNVVTDTVYEQLFPRTGLPLATRQYINNTALSESLNHYTFVEVGSDETADSYRRTAMTVTETTRQYGSDSVARALVKTQTEHQYDEWSNLVESRVEQTDMTDFSASSLVVTTNVFEGEGGGAAKGRLSRTVVEASRYGDGVGSTVTQASQFTYYPNGLLHTSVLAPEDPRYKLATTKRYDKYGNTIQVDITGGVDAAGNTSQTRTTRTSYDPRGRFVHSTTNGLGDVALSQYNQQAASQVTGRINQAAVIDANGRKIIKAFDSWGRVVTETNPDLTQTHYRYELCGQVDCAPFANGHLLTSKTKAGTPSEQLVSDKYGREIGTKIKGFDGQWIVTAKTYDAMGRVTRQYEPHFAAIGQYYSEVLYDDFNRVIGERMPNGSTNTRYYQGLETLFEDSNGKQTVKKMNAFGEQAKVTDDLYNELTFEYDAKGNLLRSYVQSNGGRTVLRTELEYDNYGRKIKSDDLDKGAWQYSYNAFGELLSQTNASGQVTQLQYDMLGRKVKRQEPEGTACWLYGNKSNKTAGMLITERLYNRLENDCNASGYHQQKTFGYDAHGRLTITATKIDNTVYSTAFSYDNLGRIKNLQYPNNLLTVENRYNEAGYLYQRRNQTTGLAYQTIEEKNARGQITQVDYGNGAQENTSYQADTGWIDNISLEKGGTLHNLSYRFDDLGNLTWREHQLSAAPAVFAENYNYDDLYRLYDRTITVQSGGSTLPAYFKQTLSTRYDDWGNIIEKSDTGHYKYDDANPYRLLDICNGEDCNQKESIAASKSCPAGSQLNAAKTQCEQTVRQPAKSQDYLSCPAGYTLNGETCSKAASKPAQVIDTCPSGWTLNGTTCSRIVTKNATGERVYSCPTGYRYNGSICEKHESQQSQSKYHCDNGWSLSGTTCQRTLSQVAKVHNSYSCPTGYGLSGTSCRKTLTTPASKRYYCSSGYQLSGQKCLQTKAASNQTLYTCPSGYTRSGKTCTQTKSATATTVPASCPSGYRWNASSGKCYKWVTVVTSSKPNSTCKGGEPMGGGKRMWECLHERDRGSTTQYVCSTGWTVSGSKCTKSQPASSHQKKFCPLIYQNGEYQDWTLSGSTCTRTDHPRSASFNYYCASGYNLSGSSCSKLLTQNATKTTTYSCPAGYVRSGTNCSKAESKNAVRLRWCPTGWGLQGENCLRRLTQTATSKMVYSCASGWSVSGSKCLKTETRSATRTYQCESGWNKSGTQCHRTLTEQAQTLSRLTCPKDWSLQGEQCVNTLRTPPQLSCPANWTVEGNQCTRLTNAHYKMQYDARGNITQDGSRRFDYTSYDLVKSITQGGESSRFEYDVNRARFKRADIKIEAGVDTYYTTYYVGGHYEKVNRTGGGKAALTEQKLYVGNAVITIRSNNSSDTYYLHKDHQGSTTTITNALGTVVQQLTYDPWGKQTAAFTHSLLGSYASPAERQGYTGHESVSHLDIIHMNGRIYDANIGRFLQADPFIQQTDNLQNYNRYAYVLNNPMSYTDPSGFFFDKIWKEIKSFVGIIVVAVASYFCATTCGPAIWAAIGGASGAISAAVNGGNIFRGALIGAVTAGVAAGMADSGVLETLLTNGFVGGIASEVTGGNFGHGFIAAGVSGLAGGAIGQVDNAAGRIVLRGAIGGTISEVTGGKFANGAKSAAFAQIVGELSNYATSQSSVNGRENQVKDWSAADEKWLQETMNQNAIDIENGNLYAYEPGWMRLQERALLDGEFGSGTYVNVMEESGGMALEGAATLAGGYGVYRGGAKLLYNSLSSPRVGHRLFTETRKNGSWNTGKHRFGWSGKNGSNEYKFMYRYKKTHVPTGIKIQRSHPNGG
ncbi:hypothetical protein TUM4438_40000 [Shewanella sairae]|uniref:Insecticide toxin TcdB middle/N-terminal domain-containing protein n=1 Tax=Shewanella sairae TaxID=190310 RepID=A0ABQ4PQ84_9GAMM|nr:FG-GAP-like repeat-containing protein [Shewanella sairae]MCL1132224.1 FG-GAP-like repeat-containing protein [Shewanella sairae]GIU51200.1 hypothetical protein TUM4438_40000 [Shewanella sairae]